VNRAGRSNSRKDAQPRTRRTDASVGARAGGSGPEASRPLGGLAPRNEQIYEDLCARIRSGEYPLDSQLPSERELTTLYGVSRETLRQALNRAVQDGIVAKVPGRGNFVMRPRVAQDLSQMESFRSVIAALDMKPSYRLLASRWVPAPAEIASKLNLRKGSSVLHIDAVGMASNRPMAAYGSYLPRSVADEVLAKVGADGRSTYELAALALGLAELRVDQTFESVLVDEQTAGLLEIPTGVSAFRATSLFSTPAGEPIELRTAIYPGGRYSFSVQRLVPISS
jgi:GntR family transcriptional regulator